MARIGGRGCPNCGSHNTEGLTRAGAQWCLSCDHRWVPCSRTCRGWELDLRHPDGPIANGCPRCGVPNRIARTWSEVWNDLARHLQQLDKLAPTVDRFPAQQARRGSPVNRQSPRVEPTTGE